jgi:hypothetical protein
VTVFRHEIVAEGFLVRAMHLSSIDVPSPDGVGMR